MLVDPVGLRRLRVLKGEGLSLVVDHPKLQALRALWLRQKGARALPPREDFGFGALRIWLGHIAIIDVTPPPVRFCVRLYGTALTDMSGADRTGVMLDDAFEGAKRETVLEVYRACAAQRSPVVRAVRYATPERHVAVLEQLLLPCSADGARVDAMIGAAYLRLESQAAV